MMHMKFRRRIVPRLWLMSIVFCAPLLAAGSRDRIIIVGSSTVYPFSGLVAQHFARSGPFAMPEVRSTSTTDGFRQLCAAGGTGSADITNASRRITPEERAFCAAHGVKHITEVQVGYDSLILASSVKVPAFDISLEQLWRASAKFVPIGGRLVRNPYRNWRDIGASLPERPIQLFGPGPGHGTRDAFVELVMRPSCRPRLADLQLSDDLMESACSAVRDDGRWQDVGDLELILGKLARYPQAAGILTYSYLDQFPNRIHAATVDGVAASPTAIVSALYPVSRPLFMYINEAHLDTTMGLADFAAEFLSFCAAGRSGYLSSEGLVPMPMPQLLRQRAIVARLQR